MSKKKPLTLNKAAIQRIKNETIEETMILVSGYLMDDLDYSDEKIVEIWEGVQRYSDAVSEHLISITKVCDIIKERTGLQILKRYENNTINRR